MMRGYLLNYSIQTNTGYISGDDGHRYEFRGEDWQENSPPQKGSCVDFQIDGFGKAVAVFTRIDDKNINFMNKIEARVQYEHQYEKEANYTVIDWFKKCLRNYINFGGRARRAEFWSFQLCYWAVFIIGLIIIILSFTNAVVASDSLTGLGIFYIVGCLLVLAWSVFSVLMFIPMVAVAVRRLHDINLSGFWLLLHFIAIGSIAVWIMFCIDTVQDTNQWGPPAKLKK